VIRGTEQWRLATIKETGDGELGWRVLVRGEEVRGFKPKQF
jgi:hypothetical protein